MLLKNVNIIFVLITLYIYGLKAQKQDPDKKKITYGHGTYGNKAREITRLETKNPGSEISGKTHQFEHPVPMRQLLQNTNLVRGKGEGGKIERSARAYSEVKERHADHIGTGNFVKQSQQGIYLKDMVNAEGNGEDSKVIMIQLNQLGYVIDKNNWAGKAGDSEKAKQFQETSKTEKGQISSDSFNFMIATDPGLSETAKLESVLTRMLMDEGKSSYTNDDVFKAQETLKMITKEIEDDKAEKNKRTGMKIRKKNQKKRQRKEKQKKKEEKDENEEKEEDKKEKDKEESNKENDENSKNEEKNKLNEEKPANNENEKENPNLNNDDKEKEKKNENEKMKTRSQKSSGA